MQQIHNISSQQNNQYSASKLVTAIQPFAIDSPQYIRYLLFEAKEQQKIYCCIEYCFAVFVVDQLHLIFILFWAYFSLSASREEILSLCKSDKHLLMPEVRGPTLVKGQHWFMIHCSWFRVNCGSGFIVQGQHWFMIHCSWFRVHDYLPFTLLFIVFTIEVRILRILSISCFNDSNCLSSR